MRAIPSSHLAARLRRRFDMPSYCDKQCPPMGLPRAIAEHGEATLRRMLQRMNNTSPLLRSIGLLACALAAACHDGGTPSPVAAPGEPTTAKTRALAAGAAALQSQTPIAAHDTYLDGFHFYNGRPQAQMEAHHYCNVLSEDLIQCVIYDGSRRDAKLMGIEYVLSARLFQTLPPAEKLLWHSHVHDRGRRSWRSASGWKSCARRTAAPGLCCSWARASRPAWGSRHGAR